MSSAVGKRKLTIDLILHTDRSVEYRDSVYQKALRRYGTGHNLTQPRKSIDNAYIVVFNSLKYELISNKTFQTTQ